MKKPLSKAEELRKKKLKLVKEASRIDKIRRTMTVGGQKMNVTLPGMSWDPVEKE